MGTLGVAKRVLGWLGMLLVVVAVAAAGVMTFGPRFGWNTHPVLTGSMEPTLGVGGVIITEPVRAEDIQVGDIITFERGKDLITHRVVEIQHQDADGKPLFKTQGDANNVADAELVSSNGEYVSKTIAYIPRVAELTSFAKDKNLLLALIVVPGLLLILLLLGDLRSSLRKKQQRKNSETES